MRKVYFSEDLGILILKANFLPNKTFSTIKVPFFGLFAQFSISIVCIGPSNRISIL